uniref:PITH domain-containing protein n=1 Tax=Globodera pallida TaxID=36090 RepID=A0A183CND8_GLOPA
MMCQWNRNALVTNGMCSHGNGHGGPCSSVVESFEQHQEGTQYTMERFINKDRIVVLNESIDGSGKKVFKRWDERMDKEHIVESDVDEELLFSVPFTANVKLNGICFIGKMDGSFPARVRIFKDRMSFDEAESAKPEQEMELKQDNAGLIDYPLTANKFNSVGHLTLHFPANFGEDKTCIYYIGLRGSFHSEFRERIVIATYEARPMADDHKAELKDPVNNQIC